MNNQSYVNRKKSRIRLMYLIAFLVPVVIVTVMYLGSEVWPIGDQCFMKTDMYHQYVPFFSEFRHKLTNGGSLLYTHDIGMGVNFAAVYAYYLASPLNWLVILVSEDYVIEFMNLLTIVKIGLAGLAFTWYLARKANDKNDPGPALFGIAYALSGYVCAYYWNTMWLDCIILFPVIAGNLETLVKKGRMFPYALALGACITSNYYISIMICIFLVLYFAALNVLDMPEDAREFLQRCGRFALASLIAGAMAAVLLLPAFYALNATASGSSTFPKTVKEYFSIVEMLARLQPAVTTEQVLEHWPNIYSGTFVFVLFPLYLMNRKISIKEKTVYITLSVFLLASFSINVLDYIWHGLHFPNSLPCRQSFAFVLLLLLMCFRTYEGKKDYQPGQIGIALVIALAFLIFVQKDADTKYYPFYVTWVAMALCAVYALLLVANTRENLSRSWVFMMALLFVVTDVTVNGAVTSFTTCSRSYYIEDNEDVKILLQGVLPYRKDGRKERGTEQASGSAEPGNGSAEQPDPAGSTGETGSAETAFFRIDRGPRRTKNDGAWLHFPTVSLFSSTANASCTKLMTKLGCEASINAYSITGSTPLVDMLLDVRYVISGKSLAEQSMSPVIGKRLIGESGNTRLYENYYTLPVGYVLPPQMADDRVFSADNPVTVQNSICEAAGVDHVLVEEFRTGTANGKNYTIYTSETGEYYAFVTNTGVKAVSVSIDGETTEYSNLDRKYLIKLGQLRENQMIKFTSKTDGQDMKVDLYRVDFDALSALYDRLSTQAVTVTRMSDTGISCTVNADPKAYRYSLSKARLCFSIPYDEGWTVTVDGVKTETKKACNEAFLSVDVGIGTHDIELQYRPKGLTPGIIITASGYLGLLLLFWLDTVKRKKDLEERRRRRSSRVTVREPAKPGQVTEETEKSGAGEFREISEAAPAEDPEAGGTPEAGETAETGEKPEATGTSEAGETAEVREDPEAAGGE